MIKGHISGLDCEQAICDQMHKDFFRDKYMYKNFQIVLN